MKLFPYNSLRNVFHSKRGSPLVEESILLGLALFAFMILAAVIFDIVEFAQDIFSKVAEGLDKFPT